MIYVKVDSPKLGSQYFLGEALYKIDLLFGKKEIFCQNITVDGPSPMESVNLEQPWLFFNHINSTYVFSCP